MELKKKDDGYWHVGYQTDQGYRWKNTHATTKEEAEEICRNAKIAELEIAAKSMNLTGEVLSSIMAGRKVTCQTVMEQWIEHRSHAKSPVSVQIQTYLVAKFLNENGLMKKIINRVDEAEVHAYVNGPDSGGKSSREGRLAALRNYFKFARARGYMVGSPADMVEINHRLMTHEQKEPRRRVPITEAEYRFIMSKTTGFQRWATAISYWAGLRLTDVACLEWASFQDNEIVSHTRKRGVRVALPLTDPLIGSGELSLILLEIMEAVPRRGKSAKFMFAEEAEMMTGLERRCLPSTYYARMLDRIGIKGKSFHCLRHAFATRLAAAGKTEEQIGRLIGHANTETTRGYIHL